MNDNTKTNNININPKLKIIKEKIINNDNQTIVVNIIRDDLLEGGTKSRGIIPYFKQSKATEFVYVTPTTGSAQVTLAYSASLTGKKITLFMNKLTPRNNLTQKALRYNTVKLVEKNNASFKHLTKLAEKYVKNIQKKEGADYVEYLTLGFHNPLYKKIVVEQLKKALPKKIKDNNPDRLWVVGGSSLLANALYEVLPNTHIMLVQVGKTIWPDMINEKRTTLFVSDEEFYNEAKIQPPFPTTKSYDAKLWTFVLKYGNNNDYVWNVTSDEL